MPWSIDPPPKQTYRIVRADTGGTVVDRLPNLPNVRIIADGQARRTGVAHSVFNESTGEETYQAQPHDRTMSQ
jgi:hypothetical protein